MIVTTSHDTYSSEFALLRYLYKSGAIRDAYLTKSEITKLANRRVLFNFGYGGNGRNIKVPFYPDMAAPVVFEWMAPLITFDEKYLDRFAGIYDFQGAEVVIRRSDSRLLLKVGGQPEAPLSPLTENFFELAGGEKIMIKRALPSLADLGI